jgi:hypothetical protein
MLSGYMTGAPHVREHNRQPANTRINKERITELRYIGRAPFKRRPRSPSSSLVDFSRHSQQPRAAAKFLGLIGFPRRPHPLPPPPTYTGQTKPKAAASPNLPLLPGLMLSAKWVHDRARRMRVHAQTASEHKETQNQTGIHRPSAYGAYGARQEHHGTLFPMMRTG